MIEITEKQQKIIMVFLQKGTMQSSAVHAELLKNEEDASLITIKRLLSEMTDRGILVVSGSGRSTKYDITTLGRLFANVDAEEYGALDPDNRFGMKTYNFSLLSEMPLDIFTEKELMVLNDATDEYKKRTTDLPVAIQKKELERLIIELSWKSSKIEGNTYTILETEKLILENEEAEGHSQEEATMILNHKEAFTFIHENPKFFIDFNRTNLEKLHAILVKDLDISFGLRERPVGITGSRYVPLDNIHQIKDAVDALVDAISKMSTPYAKAFMALLGISYIQPFGDGNKRTARLMANALLFAYGYAPLSYRSIDEKVYRNATLVFYELNSLVPFKNIFVGQYDFAARNYAVK